MNRPTQIVKQSVYDAALIIAGSELCLDGERTDLSGILRALDRVGLRFISEELNVVIERARMERAAAQAMEVRHVS